MNEITCLNHGFVALVNTMGDDRTPARTARTSYRNANQERTEEQDAKLTDYLIRNHHNTPLEFIQLMFYVKLPIFVARQFVRHRTCSINEVSYRYVTAAREFYVPELERMQCKSDNNKQGSNEALVRNPEFCQALISKSCDIAFDSYEQLLEQGLAPELARTVLPCGTYTEWYWRQDMHNFLHMMQLRLDTHAQYETRIYARSMLDLVRPLYPTIVNSWQRAKGVNL